MEGDEGKELYSDIEYEGRIKKIKACIEDYHANLLEDNTKSKMSPKNVANVIPLVETLYDTLNGMLALVLSREDADQNCEGVYEQFPDEIVRVLCPLMFPWHPNLHADMKNLIDSLSRNPFSPKKSL